MLRSSETTVMAAAVRKDRLHKIYRPKVVNSKAIKTIVVEREERALLQCTLSLSLQESEKRKLLRYTEFWLAESEQHKTAFITKLADKIGA